MSEARVIEKTAGFMKKKLSGEGSGHDWWHIYRVWQLAKHMAAKEGKVNLLTVELSALLHDIADWKFNDGDSSVGANQARDWLESLRVEPAVVEEVCYIVEHISFKGGTNKYPMRTIEGMIVQDADRLDALGAIGIARTFAYGGFAGREIYDPSVKPKQYGSLKEFKNQIQANHTVNHFYEKLLLLKDRMNTKTGRQIAQKRHVYMEKFLQEFYAEWDGHK